QTRSGEKSPAGDSLPQVLQSAFAEERRPGSAERELPQHVPCLRLGMQSQYPRGLVRPGIQAAPRTTVRRVSSLSTIVCCLAEWKSRARLRGRAGEQSPSATLAASHLSPGQGLLI